MELKSIVNLSDEAVLHLSNQLDKRGKGLGVRVGIKTTGCSGLAYVLEFVDEVQPDDQIIECNGVKLFVDPNSMTYIKGTSMDYVKDGINEGFKFSNPNSKGECGCGESFHT